MTDEQSPPTPPDGPSEPEDRPRRSSRHQKTELPTGYRSSRRSSKVLANAKQAQRSEKVADALDSARRTTRNVLWLIAWTFAIALAVIVGLLLIATAINGIVRWNSLRVSGQGNGADAAAARVRQNTLYIGVSGGKPVGFLATRVDPAAGQAFGIAIPDGAFLEVPGQGFERLGDAYPAGAKIILPAVSNFLGVPFQQYAIVPASSYQAAVKSQSLAGLIDAATESNLSPEARRALSQSTKKIAQSNTAVVPLPVKPISLGSQTYFEPQRAQIADLIKQWWGVQAAAQDNTTRVILYNGAGTPGIAGVAGQQLIRAGMRVVDTKNADKFTYKNTIIVVQRGPVAAGTAIAKVLGVGQVVQKPADQDVADVIVIIGHDYKPPAGLQ